jgi:hypothetical protein
MISSLLYDALDSLAERYIPEGKHKLLHVDSRESWRELMINLIEKDRSKARVSVLAKCAIHWETLLINKLSIQN